MICHCSVGWFWSGFDKKNPESVQSKTKTRLWTSGLETKSQSPVPTTTPGSQTQQNLGFFVSEGHDISTALHVKLLLRPACVCVCWQADVGFASTWEHRKQLVSSRAKPRAKHEDAAATSAQKVLRKNQRERCEMCSVHNQQEILPWSIAAHVVTRPWINVVVSPRLDRLTSVHRGDEGWRGGRRGREEKRRRRGCQVWKCAEWEFLHYMIGKWLNTSRQ